VTGLSMRHRRWWLVIAVAASMLAAALLAGCTAETRAELEALAGVNAIREQNGLPPLTPDAALTDVARVRSRDMASKGYFSHDPPDGCNYACIMDNHGVPYAYAGENIAWNTWPWKDTARIALDMWRNSPPHMANILNCHYERIGVGVARASDGRIYFTTIFEGNRSC
jgi:uncharacterized protein YkwD